MSLPDCSASFDNLTDEELRRLIVIELATLEEQGVLMPRDWQVRATDLDYLNSMLISAIKQLRALIKREKKVKARNSVRLTYRMFL